MSLSRPSTTALTFISRKEGTTEPQYAEVSRKISAAVGQRRTEKALAESQQTLSSIIDFLQMQRRYMILLGI